MKGPDSKSGRSASPAQEFESLHLRHCRSKRLNACSALFYTTWHALTPPLFKPQPFYRAAVLCLIQTCFPSPMYFRHSLHGAQRNHFGQLILKIFPAPTAGQQTGESVQAILNSCFFCISDLFYIPIFKPILYEICPKIPGQFFQQISIKAKFITLICLDILKNCSQRQDLLPSLSVRYNEVK